MTPSIPPPAPVVSVDPAVLLHGGVDVVVPLFSGEQQTVKVRLLPVDQSLRLFLELIGDPYALADFITGSSPGWSKTVQPCAVLDLAERAVDLNFVLACRWAELQAKFLKLALELKNPPTRNPSAPASASSAPTTAT